MIENRRPNSGKNIVSLPQPEKGMFKTRDELASFHKISSGKVSVEQFPVADDVILTGIKIGAEIGERTLGIINKKITSLPNPSIMKSYSEDINRSVPGIEMTLDGRINFLFEDQVVAGLTSTDGLVAKNDYFEDDAEITSVKLIHPETPEDMYEFRFTRRQQASGTDDSKDIYDHVLSVSYFFKTADFKEMHDKIAAIVSNPHYNPEKIRDIINVTFDIRTIPQLKNDDSGGGGALLERGPFDDDDSGGMQ